MAAAYGGLNVRDPSVSLRRVWVLLERMPPQGRRGGEHWSVEAELLAMIHDRIAELTWVTLRANGSKTAKPKPLPRPPAASLAPARPQPRAVSAVPKADGWLSAAQQLAVIPGVRVDHDA